MAYKVARSKTTLDDIGKELVAGWKDQAKEVDANRKLARETLDALKIKVRKPLTDWEEKEAKRIEGIELKMEKIRELSLPHWEGNPLTAAELKSNKDQKRSSDNFI